MYHIFFPRREHGFHSWGVKEDQCGSKSHFDFLIKGSELLILKLDIEAGL